MVDVKEHNAGLTAELPPLDAAFYERHPDLKAFAEIIRVLEPLSRDAQARVLLHAILAFTPKAFSEQELMTLVRAGKARAA